MRLHRLEIEAFGPFSGHEEVDFDRLSDSGLFLLSGPTGAGKTSVLDAVCFALFGEVPGARDDAGRLASDHRAPNATPRVTLEATLGARRIRVSRVPRHTRPRKRGGKKAEAVGADPLAIVADGDGRPGGTADAATPATNGADTAGRAADRNADLIDVGASAVLELAEPDGTWQAVAAKIPEVRRELDPLLGMTAEQFLQVAMLPQGAFATFLRADAKARQQVLERLFDAGRFSKLELWLQDRARETRGAVQEAQVVADRELAAAAGAWGANGGERQATAPEQPAAISEATDAEPEPPGAPDHDSSHHRPGAVPLLDATPGATVDEVRSWISREEERLTADATQTEDARLVAVTAATAAEQSLREVQTRAERQQRRRDAEAELQKVQAHRAGRDRLAAELAAHRVASPLVPHLSADRAACARAQDAATELGKARRYVEQLEDPALAEDPSRWAAASRSFGEQAAELDALRIEEDGIAGRERELVRLEQAAAEHARQATAAVEAIASGEEALRTATAEREQRAQRLGAAAALNDALSRATAALEAGVQREQLIVRLTAARDAARTAIDAHQAARDAVQELTRRRLDGYAAELAGGLVDGAACAVCGATDHPSPAHSDVAVVTAEDIEQATAAERSALTAREAAEQQVHALDRDLAAARVAAGGTNHRDAGRSSDAPDDGAPDRPVEGGAPVDGTGTAEHGREGIGRATDDPTVEELRAARDTAQQQVEAAAAEAQAVQELTQRITGLEQQIKDTRGAAQAANQSQTKASAELTAGQTALAQLQERITTARGEADTVAARIYQLRDAEKRLHAAAQAWENDATARKTAEEAAEQLRVALADSTFTAAEDAIAAVVTTARAQEIDRKIRAFDESKAGAEAILAQPEIQAVTLDPPADVACATAAHAAAQATASQATTAAATSAACLQALTAQRDGLLARLDALGPLATAAHRAYSLSELTRGGAGNQRKIQLSSWVLAARLEQVTVAATVHLLKMSAGRYALVLHEEPASGRGKGNAGLGLRVLDGWTGEQRDTSTLSGGESFFASLALALGLAETVSAEAGGLDLGTLFIDEGFGSLDEQTLDEVLDVLDSLRDGGRAVGIVSHVPELKQRIPVQLVVEKTRAGSRLRQGVVTGA